MKLIIDIPEDVKGIIDRKGTNENVTETLWQAVKNGIPLKEKTNGEVIRTLFQYNDFTYNLSVGRKNIYFALWHPDNVKIQCTKEWWNKLYKENKQ